MKSIILKFCEYLFLFFLISCTGANKSNSNSNHNEVESSSIFISGIKNAKTFSLDQTQEGLKYYYVCGRKFELSTRMGQLGLEFIIYNENQRGEELDINLEAGNMDKDMEWGYTPKPDVVFLIGQYDFNADDIDELIIAVQDNDEGNNGLSINVFQLKRDSWVQIGVMTGGVILGTPKAEVKMNKITIPRNLRGFYYQWTFESGGFRDTGSYSGNSE